MRKVKIGELLTRKRESVNIENDKYYKRLTIRMYHKGVCLRDVEKGENIGTKNQFLVRQGQFIMSRIDAKNGAFGIIPSELDGAVVSNDFMTFEVNKDLIDIEYFRLYSQTRAFLDFCVKGSTGTTNRKRLKEELFLNFEIIIPEKKEQNEIVKKYKRFKVRYDVLQDELKYQLKLITYLRQSILLEAVQGKLVPQDPNEEPASFLLEKIKEEKEKLIKEGKIKKEKPLPPISEDEIPYELPKGWEWVRLGEVCYNFGQKKPEEKFAYIDVSSINKERGIIGENVKIIDPQDAPSRARKIVSQGTVIYSTVRPYLLNIAIIDKEFKYTPIVSTAFAVMHTYNSVYNKYLYYYLRSKPFVEYVEKQMVGMAYPAISEGNLFKGPFPLPPLNEQKRIVEKVDQIMALCDELEKNIEQAKKDSEMLMQAVLQEAFREA